MGNYRRNMGKAWKTPWRMFRYDQHLWEPRMGVMVWIQRIAPRPWLNHANHFGLLGGPGQDGSFMDTAAHVSMIGHVSTLPKKTRHEVRKVATQEMFKCTRMKYRKEYEEKSFWERPSYNLRALHHVRCVHETWAALMAKNLVSDTDIEIPFVYKGKFSEF